MTAAPLRVLAVATSVAAPALFVEACAGWAEAIARLGGDETFDVVVADADAAPATPADIAAVAARSALVIVAIEPDAEHALGWLRHGADDVIGRDELAAAGAVRRLRFALERQRRRLQHQFAYSTDSATGLPHRRQLVEHLSQLLALREREPAPMAVLAFRIEGLQPRSGGAEAADAETLRRKIAVRLRAGVRGSDVVAAIDDDAFAILLGSILSPADADRVAAKIVAALLAPFTVGAIERVVGVALGIAQYPADGQDAERLLRRACALAAAAPASVPGGAAAQRDARAAANDDR